MFMVQLRLYMNVYGPAMFSYECPNMSVYEYLWSSYVWLCMFMVQICLAMNVYGPAMSCFECLWSKYVFL